MPSAAVCGLADDYQYPLGCGELDYFRITQTWDARFTFLPKLSAVMESQLNYKLNSWTELFENDSTSFLFMHTENCNVLAA